MLNFDHNKINDFSKIKLKAKITIIALWNALFFLEFASWVDWDINNLDYFMSPDFRIQSNGFIIIALVGGFLLAKNAKSNNTIEKWLFVEGSSAKDNEQLLNFLSLVLGILSIGWLCFTFATQF